VLCLLGLALLNEFQHHFLTWNSHKKQDAWQVHFVSSESVVSVLLARTSEDTRWETDVLSNCRLLGGGFTVVPQLDFAVWRLFFITDCLKHLFVGWALWSTLLIFFQSQGLSILCIREAGCYCFPLAQLLLNGVSETHSDWSSCEQALRTSALMMEHCKMCTCLSIIWVLGWFDIMRCILRFCRHELWDTGGYIHDAMCMIFIIG
jgi:hypothetical protein